MTVRITPWRETCRQLLRAAGDRAGHLRASLLGLLTAAIAQGLALACLLPLFDALLSHPDRAAALVWLCVMTALALLATLLRWHAQGFDYNGEMTAVTHQLRTRLGEQLRRMPLEQLQDKRAGEVHATLLGNVDENLTYTLTIVNVILGALVTPFIAALATLAWDWRLGLLLLLVFPAIIPLYHWRRPAYARGMRALAAAHERTSGDIVEYAQGLPVLRAARCEGERAAALQAGFAHLERIQTIGQRKGAKPNVVIASVVELGLLAVMATGIGWAVQGSLDLAVLAAVMVMVVRFAEPLATFVSFTAVFELIETALERISALLAIEPLPQRTPARVPEHFEVCFESVDFQYAQASALALHQVSATLAACSMTALVGPSGSGKTTLIKLLLRHGDPQQGRITIGGVDLREIPPDRLQGLVSVVFQDVYLFDDTVLANIRLARPDARDAEVEAAARAAQCESFIDRLPQKWHTPLGDAAARLSGGERQRLSIARALLKDAPIVVLDEPTAALDTASELAVQAAFDALVRDKTVIVIAHRLSTIAGADRILVLDDARMVEQGDHRQLLAGKGRYWRLWQAQLRAKRWQLAAASSHADPSNLR